MKPIIIVGAGLAGYTLAREVRKLDKDIPLIIITADDGGFYSKPMLSNAFAQSKSAGQLITQSATQMAAQLSATIMTGTRVQHIHTSGKTVSTNAGVFEYDKLILAVGAQPIRLPLEGDAANAMLSVNHVGDYAEFRQKIAQLGRSARIAILGAGLIGCEFADDLATARQQVTLIDPNQMPLAALAAPALGLGLRAALEERGVTLHLGTTATRVDRHGDTLRLTLANGKTMEADIVLSAVGLRPDIHLAQAAQLKTGRGVLVDQYGSTSAADVYALGDCAEYATGDGSRTLPYIAPLMAAARAVARTLTGESTPIDIKPTPIIVKTPSFPLALMPPPVGTSGTWTGTQFDSRIICRHYNHEGTMTGFGLAPQEATLRQKLLAELGTQALNAA